MVLTGLCFFLKIRENLFLTSYSFWCLLAFLVLWPSQPNLCHHGHTDSSSVCIKFLCLSSIITLLMAFMVHPDNPGQSSHLKIFNITKSVKLYHKQCSHKFRLLGPDIFGGTIHPLHHP